MTDPRGITGAPEVAALLARLMDRGAPHCRFTVYINGNEVGYSGSLAGARHYLAVLEAQLDDRCGKPDMHGGRFEGHGQ